VGSNKSVVMSRRFSFKTPPDPNPDAGVRMIAFGGIFSISFLVVVNLSSDMGFGHVDHTNAYTRYLENPSLNTSRLILGQVNDGKADIVLHIGEFYHRPNVIFLLL